MPRMLVYCMLSLALWCGRPALADLDTWALDTLREVAWSCGHTQALLDAFDMGHLTPNNKQEFLDFVGELGASDEQKQIFSEVYEVGYESSFQELEKKNLEYSEDDLNANMQNIVELAQIHDAACSGDVFEPKRGFIQRL